MSAGSDFIKNSRKKQAWGFVILPVEVKFPNFYYENKLWENGLKYVAGIDEVGRGSFAGPVVAAAVAFASNFNFQFPVFKRNGGKIYINDSKKLTARRREIADEWIKENAVTWGVGKASVSEINRFGIAKATYSAFRRAVAYANVRLHNRVDFLLIDAFYVPYVRGYPVGRKNKVMGLKKQGNEEIIKSETKKPRTVLVSSRGLRSRTRLLMTGTVGWVERANLRDKLRAKEIVQNDSRQLAIINGDSKSISIAAASIVAKVYRDELMMKLGKNIRNINYGWEKNKGYGTGQHQNAILKYGITRHHRKQFVKKLIAKN